MSGAISWRSAAVSAQVAALIVALGCDSASPMPPTAPSIRRLARWARLAAQ
jgi:hypothetical protein